MAIFSLLATFEQYFGKPIECMKISKDIPDSMINTYCWITSTFSVPNRWERNNPLHHGIAPEANLDTGKEMKYHKYYQWVPFFFALEAILFYLPRYVWKSSENGKVKMLVGKLNEPILHAKDPLKMIKLKKTKSMRLSNTLESTVVHIHSMPCVFLQWKFWILFTLLDKFSLLTTSWVENFLLMELM